MKIRNGFVSNSSSSSFVIQFEDVTNAQVALIQEHITMSQNFMDNNEELDFGSIGNGDRWDIETNDTDIQGRTWMDNFDMYEFLKYIGVDMDKVKWDY